MSYSLSYIENSSSNGHTGGNIGLRLAIEPLLVEYGVSLCVWADGKAGLLLSAHDLTADHVYERTYPMDRYHFDEHHFGDWDIHLFVNPDKPIHAIVGTGGIDLGINHSCINIYLDFRWLARRGST